MAIADPEAGLLAVRTVVKKVCVAAILTARSPCMPVLHEAHKTMTTHALPCSFSPFLYPQFKPSFEEDHQDDKLREAFRSIEDLSVTMLEVRR